ncbi:MAG: helix-turn-helix transcriptional regulator [Oscillospiraceae bacterium]|nr:helix-turn-helix transcriptional regulator [Oscillospiraceae bacterium]
MQDFVKLFGERVKYYRKKSGLSQEKLSELCDLHPTYIGQIERGEKKASLDTIMRICKGLELSPENLFEKLSYQQENTPAQKAYDLFMQTPPEKQQTLLQLLEKAIELI